MMKAEYARHRGVSRQAIDYLIKHGKIPETAFIEQDGKRVIDAAAADFALGESRERILLEQSGDDDAVGNDPTFGSVAGAARSPQGENIAALTRARTATEIYRARMAELEYDQMVGKLMAVEDVTAAMQKCASVIVRELDQLPNFSDEIVAAFSRDGIQGVRMALKGVTRNVRVALEQNMRLAAAEDMASKPSALMS
ncbi:hypothetical protein A1D31_39660 [Bradyrhizobium liaoningense]|nr:hypothetical protein A1D31_39660 [Bradyrhizobium liaoningense]